MWEEHTTTTIESGVFFILALPDDKSLQFSRATFFTWLRMVSFKRARMFPFEVVVQLLFIQQFFLSTFVVQFSWTGWLAFTTGGTHNSVAVVGNDGVARAKTSSAQWLLKEWKRRWYPTKTGKDPGLALPKTVKTKYTVFCRGQTNCKFKLCHKVLG